MKHETMIWPSEDVDQGNCVMFKVLYEGPLKGSPEPDRDTILMLHPIDVARLKRMLDAEPTRH